MIRYRSESDYMNTARKYTNAISALPDGDFLERPCNLALIGLVFPLHQIRRVYGFYREEKPPLSATLRLLALSIRIGSIQRWSTVMALTH
jgi:hypothetical protein